MELYKRGKTWHIAEGINKAGLKIPRHTTKCKDKELAKDYLKSIELLTVWTERPNKKTAATAGSKPGLSLTEALEPLLASLKRDTTRNQYRRVITAEFIRPLNAKGITHLEEVRTLDCQELQDSWVRKGLTLNCILDYRRPANRLYSWWIKRRQARIVNPWTPVEILKEITPTRREIDAGVPVDDGVRTLPLDIDGDDNWRAVHSGLVPYLEKRNYEHPLPAEPERFLALAELFYWTGLRRSDATRFKVWLIDSSGNYTTGTTKTGSVVSLSIPEALATKLRLLKPLAWRGADPNYPGAGQYLFWDGTGDTDDEEFRKYMDNIIGRPLREFGESLGMFAKEGNGLHPHRFRDSFAINCLLNGHTMHEVSILLGHKSIKTTERYYCPKVQSRVRAILARQAALRRPFLIAS